MKTTTPRSNAVLNPRTTHYEFMGPPGALFVSILLPFATYALYFSCSEHAGGCPPQPWTVLLSRLASAVTDLKWWCGLWDTKASVIYVSWYLFCVVAWAVLPGEWVDGVELRTGGRKQYKMNAFATMLLTLGITTGVIFKYGASSFTFFYHHWAGFITASLTMAFTQACYCYATSFIDGKVTALGGNTGNPLYDWFIGRELNPAIGSFDLKFFNEMRPGLMLWMLLNISMACEQAVRLGGRITDSMLLMNLFQNYYVINSLYNEPTALTTMDITTDGFGFMLAVGDLMWVPFTYTLQTRYLVFNPIELGMMKCLAIFAVNALGVYIFRTSNSEKNDFRNGQNPKNLKYMTTESGSKLLISGWWGFSRHSNYLGDIVMAVAWSLPTGFNTPITFFYLCYFTVMIVHREHRDEAKCQAKYGKDWDKYKKLVPYRILPYVY